jgi:multicomponent Na+:H+ antiporter subunit C
MSGAEPNVIVYAFTAVALAGIAIWGFIVRADLLRRVIALNVLGAGVFLLLVAIARRVPGEAPDPVPHAMALTGIVVAVSASAFALVLLRRIYDTTGRLILPDDDPEDNPGEDPGNGPSGRDA